MYLECPLQGGPDLAKSTLTSLTWNLRAKPGTGTKIFGFVVDKVVGMARTGSKWRLVTVAVSAVAVAAVVVAAVTAAAAAAAAAGVATAVPVAVTRA